jgi:hypothetical protein
MTNLRWWVSVMVVALVLTVASAYLVPWIEGALGPLTAGLSTRTERQRQAREARIQELAQSAEARAAARYEILRHLLVGIMFITYAFGLVLLSSLASPRAVSDATALLGLLPLVFAAVCMPVGTRYLTHAAALHHELRAARDRA